MWNVKYDAILWKLRSRDDIKKGGLIVDEIKFWDWTIQTTAWLWDTWWLTYSAINSSQAITNWNYYWVTCTGDITLTLADWTSSGQNLSIKKLDNTSYTITITGNIEWETSIVIDTQYESLDLFWNWTYYLIK